MEINITALDYFRELELMEKQYGQEEDLYPWIYMLLQQAKLSDHKNENISIRNVPEHAGYASKVSFKNCDRNEAEKKALIRWQLSKRVGLPDMAVFNKDDVILGAIEIKGFDIKKKLFDDEFYSKIKNGNKLVYDLVSKQEDKKYYLKLSKKFDNKKFEGIIEKDKNSDKYFISRSEDESEADYEAKVWGILNNNNLKMCYDWQSRVYSNTNIPANEKPGQLTGHVDKFKKVLYTNGLEFYYLKLVDNQIEVECLADLTDYFYKMNEKSWTMLADEWAKLIKELAKIDWYEDPTVKIENT